VNFLFLVHCFDSKTDGAAKILSRLARKLANSGHLVEVISTNRYSTDDLINPSAPKIISNRQAQGNLLINHLDIFAWARRIFSFFEKILGPGFFSAAKKGPIFTRPFFLFRPRRLDWVISGPFPLLTNWWASLIAGKNGAKLALLPAFHTNDSSYNNRFLLKLSRRADLIFCLTKKEKRFFRQLGIKNDKLVVGGGVVDDYLLTHQTIRAGHFPLKGTVLFIGAQSAHKRIEFLIKAMKVLWGEGRNYQLVLAGPKTLYSPHIEKAINQLSQKDRARIKNLGEVGPTQKIDLIDQASLLVNPSAQESFGLVLLEAWARKKAVVVAKTLVFEEIVDDQVNGLIFSRQSETDLAEKIDLLINSKSLSAKLGKNGYNKLGKDFFADEILGRYTKALTKK